MYSADLPLWQRYERACDSLEDDLDSGYVRVCGNDPPRAVRTAASARPCASCSPAGSPAPPASSARPSAATARWAARRQGTGRAGRVRVPRREEGCSSASIASCCDPLGVRGRRRSSGSSRKGQRGQEGPAMRAFSSQSMTATPGAAGSSSTTRSTGPASDRICPFPDIVNDPFAALEDAGIPYLARHCRVVTFDGRGNGRSGDFHGGYDEREFAADAAVMEATGNRARGGSRVAVARRAARAAASGRAPGPESPEPSSSPPFLPLAATPVPAGPVGRGLTDEGWAKWNRHWLRDHRGFLESSSGPCSPNRTRPTGRGLRRLGPGRDGGDARCRRIRRCCPTSRPHGSCAAVSDARYW